VDVSNGKLVPDLKIMSHSISKIHEDLHSLTKSGQENITHQLIQKMENDKEETILEITAMAETLRERVEDFN
jgi:hypothetical protein